MKSIRFFLQQNAFFRIMLKTSCGLRLFIFLAFFLFVFLAVPEPVYADDCFQDPLNAADCMRTPGTRWVLTAGTSLGATLAAVAANLAAAGNAQKDQTEDQKKYVLHLSAQSVTVKPEEKVPFVITAYAVTAKGHRPAPEASIQVIPPAGAGLIISPLTGSGRLQCFIQAAAQCVEGRQVISVEAQAPGAGALSASLDVMVEAPVKYELQAVPKELCLQPGESGEVTFKTLKVFPDQKTEPEPNAFIQLWPPRKANPFSISPLKGKGELTCHVSAHADAPADLYYLDGAASTADKKADMKVRVNLKVVSACQWMLEFDKPRWSKNRIDLRKEIPDCGVILDELDMDGGKLVIHPYGRFEYSGQIINNSSVIQDGGCVIVRDGKKLMSKWDEKEKGYVFLLPPSGADSGNAAGSKKDIKKIKAPIRLVEHHENLLRDKMMSHLERIKSGIQVPEAVEMGFTFIKKYMEYLTQQPADLLTERNEALNIWLINTITFIGYTAETGKAFKFSLSLHERGYVRFMDALFNGIVEGLFAAPGLIFGYMKKGKIFVKETAEKGARETIETVFKEQSEALLKQKESLQKQIMPLRQELDMKNLQLHLGNMEANRMTVYAEHKAAMEELGKFEKRLRDFESRFSDLGQKIADISKSLDVLEDFKKNLKAADTLKEYSGILEKYKPKPGVYCEQYANLVQEIIAERRRVLDDMLQKIIKDPELSPMSDQMRGLIARLDDVYTQTQKNLVFDAANSAVFDLNLEKMLQDQAKELDEKLRAAADQAKELPYRAMDWDYYEGVNKFWWFSDKLLEWFYWAKTLFRDYIPGFASAEDFLAEAVSTLVEYVLIKPAHWVMEFTQNHHWVTSSISRGIRDHVQAQACSIPCNLENTFYSFPSQSYARLNQTIAKENVADQLDAHMSKKAAADLLRSGAAGGYQQERASQLSRSRQYFTNVLTAVLAQQAWSWDQDPDAECRWRVRTLAGKLSVLTETMQEYAEALAAAGAGGTAGLTAVPERLWFGKEWTIPDLEGALDWAAWAVRWVITFVSLLSISTGVAAPVGAAGLLLADRVEQIVALLRVGMHTLWIMPAITGFQYDVLNLHVLLYLCAYQGWTTDPETVLVERYVV